MKFILSVLLTFVFTFTFSQTKFEKEFFNYSNMVRTNPKGLAVIISKDSFVNVRFDKDSIKNVISILNIIPKRDSLTWDNTIYNNMAFDTPGVKTIQVTCRMFNGFNNTNPKITYGLAKVPDHNRPFLVKHNYAEILSSSSDNPNALCELVNFLVDVGNWAPTEIKTTYHTNGGEVKIEEVKCEIPKPHFNNIVNKKHKSAAVRLLHYDIGFAVIEDFLN